LIGEPAAIGRRLVHQVRAIGLVPRVGLAASRTAARMAAATGSGAVTVIPTGRERATLAKVSIAALDLAPDLAATFGRWGIRILDELAALPREGLAMRLGPPGLRAHDLALGLDRDPFRPWTPPPFWEEAQGLEWEIDSLGGLAGVLVTVLARLAALVGADNLGSPVLVDSHRADAFTMLAFSPPAEPASSDRRRREAVPRQDDVLQPTQRRPRLALRRMRPARRVEVEMAGERPARVEARLGVASAGPWRGSGGG